MSRAARTVGRTLGFGVLLALAGCASVPPYVPPTPRGPAPAPATQAAPVAPAPDTTPSRDAQDVLATIPEPLAPGERVPPLAGAPDAAADSAEMGAGDSDSARAGIPVPAPTPVLGERPLPEIVGAADTTAAPASPVPPALVTPPPSMRPPAPAAPDTCWRVQIAAPTERAKAERYLEAGRSQLLVPMVIEQEKGLFKVRARDCMDGRAADGLRRRALEAGFDGAFRFRGRRP